MEYEMIWLKIVHFGEETEVWARETMFGFEEYGNKYWII